MEKQKKLIDENNKITEKITKQNYKEYVFQKSPKSSHLKNMFWAFMIGGLICVIGQLFIEFFIAIGIDPKDSSVMASACLIALAALLTGLGVYDNIGRFAGAGSTIPITGFSNAIVSPALEFRSEGYIYGVGAKMFQIAGPVIVNGVSSAIVIALILLVLGV
ncbi:MAG: stage V sporulation protein AC, partial [Clostridia bacterium]